VALPLFSIGHSNRSLAAFVALLRAAEVGLVADIRTVPRSRANPQFNRETLPDALAGFGIGYEPMPALGGLRGRSAIPAEVNGLWENRSFHNYADYALTEPFAAGLAHLVERGRERRCAMMCSEAVWWRCHRRIVGDWLLARGEEVFHIMAEGRLEPARLTPGAVVRPDGTVVYPAVVSSDGC
jgi:uncharacterized protein (DUF488 family)